MKKVLVLFAVFMLTLTLAACGEECQDCSVLPEIPADLMLDSEDFDDYLGRADVQYVDLRNFDDKLNGGYVSGFEMIPFFDYLEYEGYMDREGNVLNTAVIENLFDKDATAIFLMCGSGTRAGWVLDALEGAGYDNVMNVGGITAYAGDNKVLGDGTYVLDMPVSGMYTPGTYFAVDPQTQYTTTIVVGAGGAIEDVVFDALYNGTTKNTLGDAYMLASGKSWASEAADLAAYVLANQGWGDIELDVTDISGLNALTVPHHSIYIDTTNSPDDVAGVSVGAEGFVLSWNLAIQQAGGTPIADVFTSEEWEAAHAPAFDYVDGVYFGMDEAHGYNVMVTVEDGFIADVHFDALYDVYTACLVGGVEDDTVAKGDCPEADQVYIESTKQVLGTDYTLASGFTWAEEADLLGDAIVDAQQWDPAWVIILGGEGEHDKFDMTDPDTLDAVGGATIGIEGFKAAFEEAIDQATPAS